MSESIGRSIELVKTSWNILMDDKKLLVFPVLPGLVTLMVVLTFASPRIFAGIVMGLAETGSGFFLVILSALYGVSYFIVIFFNTALISCVNAHPNGVEMSVGEGLARDLRHLPSILAWALISATAGIILQLIEQRAGIFVTALHSYARTGTVPSAFSRDRIEHAFVRKQAGPGTN